MRKSYTSQRSPPALGPLDLGVGRVMHCLGHLGQDMSPPRAVVLLCRTESRHLGWDHRRPLPGRVIFGHGHGAGPARYHDSLSSGGDQGHGAPKASENRTGERRDAETALTSHMSFSVNLENIRMVLFVLCCSVAQPCLTLCDPTDCSPPGSSVHGILQEEYWSG